MSSLAGAVGGIGSAVGAGAGGVGKLAQVIGTIAQVAGQITGGISEADAARENEKRSKLVAAAVLRRSEYEAELRRREGRRLRSKQQALFAKSGVEMAGTPLAIMDEAIAEAEMDALMIEEQGQVEAGGYLHEAKLYKKSAKQSTTGGFIKGGTTLLTSAGSWLRPSTNSKGVKIFSKQVFPKIPMGKATF